MHDDILLQFARHLHSLIQQQMAAKPGPFRLVELAPTLLEADADQTPALVFWVNRESFFAGGLLSLPRVVSEASLNQGRRLARALGLTRFHTWDATEMAAWSVDSDAAQPLWALAAPAEDLNTPENFRKLIGQLLAEIQQQFFNEQLDLPRMSAVYLANLLRMAFDDILAELPGANPRMTARHQLIDSLLRRLAQVLALAAESLLPRAVSVETVIEQLDAATLRLPEALASSQGDHPDPARFQGGAARRLQHLAVRLAQFGNTLRPQLANALEILLPVWTPQLQHHPTPALPAGDGPLLLLAADNIPDDEPDVALIGAGGVLAIHALLRHLHGRPLPSLQLSDPLRIVPPLAFNRIAGTLTATQRPVATDLPMLKARLRSSWPNRNLALATSAPLWHWHLLHLAGLISPPARLSLILPANWLIDKHSEILYALLSERLCLTSVSVRDEEWHHVSWEAGGDCVPVQLRSQDGRESTLRGDNSPTLDQLRVKLLLPAPLAGLIERGELQLYNDTTALSVAAVQLFLRSTPGKALWRLLVGKSTLPGEERLLATCHTHGVPLPRTEILTALAKLARQDPAPTPLQIDHEVADWLGAACLAISAVPRPALAKQREETSDIDTMIIAEVTRDGILRFPEDFLYNVPETQLLHFAALPPLQVTDSFFDNITLEAASGERIQVAGEATAHAMAVATSLGERPLALPASTQQVVEILDRYANHLCQLRTAVETAAAAHGAKQVQAAVDRIWSGLPVPPWELLKRHLPRATKVMV